MTATLRATLIVLCASAGIANAALNVYEGFSYTAGVNTASAANGSSTATTAGLATTGTGLTGNWVMNRGGAANNVSGTAINATGYSFGTLSTAGGRLDWTGYGSTASGNYLTAQLSSSAATALAPTVANKTIWMSVLVKAGTFAGGGVFLTRSGETGDTGIIPTFGMGFSAANQAVVTYNNSGSAVSSSTYTATSTYWLVGNFTYGTSASTPTYTAANLWVFDASSGNPPADQASLGTAVATFSGSSTAGGSRTPFFLVLKTGSSTANASYDEVRIGDSYADVRGAAATVTTASWTGSANNNWDNTGNWDTATIPKAIDFTATIPTAAATIGNSGGTTSFTIGTLNIGSTANNVPVTVSSASTLVFNTSSGMPVLNFINGTTTGSTHAMQAGITATAAGLSIRAGGASGSANTVSTIPGNISASGKTVSFDASGVSGIVGQRDITVSGAITAASLNNTRASGLLTLQGANTITGSTSLSGSNGRTLIRRSDAGSTTPAAITPFGSAGVTIDNAHVLSTSIASYNNAVSLANVITIGANGGTIDIGAAGDVLSLTTSANQITGSGALTITSQSSTDPTGGNIDDTTLALGAANNFSGTLKLGSGSASGFLDARVSGATGTGPLDFAGNGKIALRTSNTGGTVTLNNATWTISGSGGKILIGGDSGSTTTLPGNFSNTGTSELYLGRNTSYGTAFGSQTIEFAGTGTLGNNIFGTGATAVTLKLSNTGGTQTFNGVITNVSLLRSGAGGTTVLGGANTYAGDTTISGGTLALAGSGSIANTANISVASGAVFDVSAVGGFSLGANQTLKGDGSINGSIVVNGTLAPGTSLGTLTFNNNLTLNSGSTNVMEVNLTNTPLNADKIVLPGGALTFGGRLVVINMGPVPTNGTVFDLYDGTLSGNFATVTLPPGGATHWLTNNLTVNGTVAYTNNPPVANAKTYSVAQGETITIPVSNGAKSLATDADGDPLSFTALGSQDGFDYGTANINSGGTNLTYINTSGVAGSQEVFSYIVNDGFGGRATNSITIRLDPATGANLVSATFSNSPSPTGYLTYAGIPGTNYVLQWTPSLSYPITWQSVQTNMANTNALAGSIGYLRFTNALSPSNDYFRTKWLP